MPILTLPRAQLTASASLVALFVLCLSWELWLAPLRPGGSWLALKALPLLLPLPGLLKGRLYTYRWASLFIWLYLAEGLVRAWSDVGLSARLARLELGLAALFLLAVIAYIRLSRRAAKPKA